jgi:predicted RNA-binding protein with PIN domain
VGLEGVLRPALEAAVAVAREGEEETPSVPAPAALRPFLRFAKLPTAALAATRRALDADDEFRARVAEAATKDGVGRAGWLYLTRPEGWEEELIALVASAETSAREQADRRAQHDARRRLAAVQEAARRAEEAAAAARAEAADAVATLAEERRARQAAVEAAAIVARRVDELAEARDVAQAAAEAARLDAVAARDQAHAASEARDRLEARVRELEAEVSELRAAASTPPFPALSVPGLDEAAEAAMRLAERLRAAVAALGAVEPPGPAAPSAVGSAVPEDRSGAAPGRPASRPAAGRADAGAPPSAGRARAAVLRQPVPLPPAVYDDSVEAAEHLVRVPGVVLVVDGYNVSLSGWPDLPLPEQRRRLVDALVGLAARTGADTRVVFDGAENAMPGIVPTTAKAVHVTFSPPGVEADEVMIDLVGQLPPNRPVVVATSDRRVQHDVGRAGANVISTEQLLTVLRR